jgi:hypothetical protein
MRSDTETSAPLPPSDVRIIQDIASGRDAVNLLLKEIGWSKPALQDEVQRMVADGYVTVDGFRRRLHITPKAYDQAPNLPNRIPKEKKPKTQTSKFDVSWWLSFKIIFGALLGLFFGWLLISGLAALIYWAAYSYLLEPYVPASILPWVPFQNPIVDFVGRHIRNVVLPEDQPHSILHIVREVNLRWSILKNMASSISFFVKH